MTQHISKISSIILGLAIFFVTFQFLIQGSVGIMSIQIKKDLNLDAAGISMISSAFFYSYILMQIPAGYLLDKFGIKKTVPYAIFLMGISCLLFSQCQNLKTSILSRFLLGTSASFGFLTLLSSIKIYFPKNYFPMLVCLTESLSMIGIATFNWFFSKAVMGFGWRYSMILCGILSILLAWIAFIFLKKPHPAVSLPSEDKESSSTKQSFRKTFFDKRIWLCGLFSGCLYCVITAFVSLWAIPYISQKYNLNIVDTTNIVSCVYLGIAFASPILGWAVQFVPAQKLLTSSSLLSTFLAVIIIYLPLPNQNYIVHLCMFFLGVTCSTYQLVFLIIDNFTPSKYRATANGITNMLCMAGAPLLQPIIGFLVSLTQGGVLDGYEIYSPREYRFALWIIPATLFVSFFLAKKINKTIEKI